MDEHEYLIELSESERTDFGRVDLDLQDEPQKVFTAIWELEGQVNGEGFAGYFENGEIEEILHAPVALRSIGASRCAAIVEEAISLLEPFPATREARAALLGAMNEEIEAKLDELDQRFYTYPDSLTELLFAFVVEHPESFGHVGGRGDEPDARDAP